VACGYVTISHTPPAASAGGTTRPAVHLRSTRNASVETSSAAPSVSLNRCQPSDTVSAATAPAPIAPGTATHSANRRGTAMITAMTDATAAVVCPLGKLLCTSTASSSSSGRTSTWSLSTCASNTEPPSTSNGGNDFFRAIRTTRTAATAIAMSTLDAQERCSDSSGNAAFSAFCPNDVHTSAKYVKRNPTKLPTMLPRLRVPLYGSVHAMSWFRYRNGTGPLPRR